MSEAKKILVVGASASGKSTFARKLAKATTLPLVHIDTLMWQPGWEYYGDEKAISNIRQAAKTDAWIIEGFIFKELTKELLEQAELIIYLDYSSWILVWRYLKRTWEHHTTAREEIPGCPDSFSVSFLWRIFTKKEVHWLDREFSSGKFQETLVRFSKPKAAREYLLQL